MKMHMENEDAKSGEQELTFDIKITNGVAKLLKTLKDKLGKDTAKEVVSLGLQVLDIALQDDADLVVKKSNGEEIRIILNGKNNG